MMGLQIKSLKEIPHKVTGRKSKTSLEMGNKNYVLTRTHHQGRLAAWEPTFDLQRDLPG
jgi:hypothetical protein